MKNYLKIVFFLAVSFAWSQTDYSSDWEDFYSYNNVKDFIKVEDKIYAVVDNAVFIYDEFSGETTKISSVNGLSGETTTSIYYNPVFERLVIGYSNGLLEIVESSGEITIVPDIVNYPLFTEKEVTNITEYNHKLYLSTPFAIVVFDIENLVFGDTYFIGDASSDIRIHQIKILDETIFAATENGIYTADVNESNLIDFNKWTHHFLGEFTSIQTFGNHIYTAKGSTLYEIENGNSLENIQSFSASIVSLKASNTHLSVATNNQAYILNESLNQVMVLNTNSDYDFDLNVAFAEDSTIYLGTKTYGVLQSEFSNPQVFQEIHPDGPTSNDVFSINVNNSNLWIVYGGYTSTYTPISNKSGASHYNGENWENIPYDSDFPGANLVHITFDPNHDNKVYLSSWAQTGGNIDTGGILIIEDDIPVQFLNATNSALEDLDPTDSSYTSIRINGSAFDNQNNLWVTNAWVDNMLKKQSSNGSWQSFDLSPLLTNVARGLNELVIDNTNTIWIGTRRNGLLAYNESGNNMRALTTEVNKGGLPDPNVRTVAVDSSNRIWIGTNKGMVVLYNASSFFDTLTYNAEPIIILEDGIAEKLLGDQPINSIAIDGADNKWFGMDGGGALQSNTNGSETLQIFNTKNSPLPSNTILKIKVDNSNGKVYFATAKGIVAFNSNVAPYGDELGAVYAYPNPVKINHEFVTIDGRNGEHLPEGTNVKILDSAGYLVYETNVTEGQELQGGKVIWNKKNLAGRKVTSGIYIVLLINKDRTQTSSTKIAIIN